METRKDVRMSNLMRYDKDSQIDGLSIAVNHKIGIGEILAGQAMAWCRYWLQMFPIRMTLNNIGLLMVFLAIVSPRSFIYRLVYPIFRLVFGTLYPAYASYKAVRTKNVKEYVKWMMYWIVFALFTCAETFTDVFFSFWFPFYYEIKIILVLWLLSPATKGSSILYRRFVHPALIRREAEIDEALARATEQGYTAVLHLGTKGVNYATTVLMQTAIKGGGGLVQQLRKSYSLSDLTGEKEDENRNTPDARDETDTEVEPRRREHAGRRGYSPRRTQSSSNTPRVDMYFSEVDVDVRQQRPRESVVSLTNIKSSDDISSGYSSGEALQSQRVISQGDSLTRTSSVGARTRAKPRSTAKKTPEDRSEDFERIDLPFPENVSLPSSLNVLTPEQAVELLLLFSRSDKLGDYLGSMTAGISAEDPSGATRRPANDESSSAGEYTDSIHVDVQTVRTIEIEHISTENLSRPITAKNEDETADVEKTGDHQDRSPIELNAPRIAHIDDDSKDNATPLEEASDVRTSLEQITDEITGQRKIDELKQLLDDTHRAVANIVSSQEKLNTIDKGKERDGSVSEVDAGDSPSVDARGIAVRHSAAPSSSSRSILDDDNRAGKYRKRPAPRAPTASNEATTNDAEDVDEDESQNALKATLVIKTGTLRTVSNPDATRDIFLARTPDSTKKRKKSNRLRAKEGFNKLLTIPKNIFHNAFHKEQSEDSSKEEDSSSTFSGTSESASRSGSIGSQVLVDAKLSPSKPEVDVEEIPLRPEREENGQKSDKDIDDSIEKPVARTLNNDGAGGVDKTGNDRTADIAKNKNNSENGVERIENKFSFETREISRPRGGKEIITDIN